MRKNEEKLFCPSCKERAEMKRLNPEFWVIKCINGECEELPEVASSSKNMAIRIWKVGAILRNEEWKLSQRGCVQCVLKDQEIERLENLIKRFEE
jgi:hypothetical protein